MRPLQTDGNCPVLGARGDPVPLLPALGRFVSDLEGASRNVPATRRGTGCGQPVSCTGTFRERAEEDVAFGTYEGLGVASHLVVGDAAPPLACVFSTDRDEDGLAGACGVGDDGVAGLGAFGSRETGDAVRFS